MVVKLNERESPSVNIVDAYKDRVRQLEIENKQMRCQLGLNQHRPVEVAPQSQQDKLSAKLALNTEKLNEVVKYAKRMKMKLDLHTEESERLKKKNTSLENELRSKQGSTQQVELELSATVENLKNMLRQSEQTLDEQMKKNSLLEKENLSLSNLLDDERQLKQSVSSTMNIQPATVLPQDQLIINPSHSVVEKKPKAKKNKNKKGALKPIKKPAAKEMPVKQVVTTPSPVNNTAAIEKAVLPIAKQTPMAAELPSFAPRVLLAPIRTSSSSTSGLASLADLPAISGGKTVVKKQRKSAKKNKKMEEKLSCLNDDLDSVLGVL